MIDGEIPLVDPTLFENIDESPIAKAAMNTKGAAGPSGLGALTLRHILVSKHYGSSGKYLRDVVAMMINRKVMLHNIQYVCPSMYVHSYNSYSVTSVLFVQGGKEIISAEGTTQGDPPAIQMYAVSITPLLNKIKNGDTNNIKHAAFADDISGAEKIEELRKWWENNTTHGPLLG